MTTLAQLHDCHSCNDERSIVQKKRAKKSISVADASHLFSTFRGWLFTDEVFLYQLPMFLDCDGTLLIILRSHR